MKIPEGYRELLDGEIIKDDDLAYVDFTWVEEGSLSNRWTGKIYHYPVL